MAIPYHRQITPFYLDGQDAPCLLIEIAPDVHYIYTPYHGTFSSELPPRRFSTNLSSESPLVGYFYLFQTIGQYLRLEIYIPGPGGPATFTVKRNTIPRKLDHWETLSITRIKEDKNVFEKLFSVIYKKEPPHTYC